jgi:hypothetical protein
MIGVILLFIGMVSAVDCNSYFTKAADKRIKVISASSSLELTVNRLSSRADNLYNTLDDMDSDENLTSAVDDFTDLNDRKNDISQDMSDFNSAINSYDGAISDSRDELPNSCFKVFNLYDGDLSDVQDYYSNVKRQWNRLTAKYDIINTYRSNLAGHVVSEAKPKVDDLKEYIDDMSSEVGGGIDFTINSTSVTSDEKIYNQSECFGMVKKNVEIATKDCVDKCNAAMVNYPKSCPDVTAQNCTSAVGDMNNKYRECESKLSSLSETCKTNCPICQVCQNSDSSLKDNEISRLTSQGADLVSKLNYANLRLNETNQKYQNATAQLSKCSTCQSCLMWQIIAGALLALIILAWLFSM